MELGKIIDSFWNDQCYKNYKILGNHGEKIKLNINNYNFPISTKQKEVMGRVITAVSTTGLFFLVFKPVALLFIPFIAIGVFAHATYNIEENLVEGVVCRYCKKSQ
jgi:hypothetical protein